MENLGPYHSSVSDSETALKRLREMELIELMLDFDIDSLQFYADSIAEERQHLTNLAVRYPSSKTPNS